ncbi:hypothetical protein DS742_19270 [Lacrimispora amygdalina]|uniref:Uncharacterized protein n=1 Tax=Lacrimispora amygdalina TaxID=253257 RepID=A0A3E2N8W9_9FIRM|nr:hypothetical protein [Clostridium indicum]RFZ77331.1 hypothetical protein DS742_19270 [Clostridium indicum]
MENRFCLQMVSCGDGCCGGGSSATENVYSTEETVCGKWIDGKTIYRKVIVGKLAKDSVGSTAFANVSDLAIDCLVNLYGNTKENNNVVQLTLQTSYNLPDGINGAINMYYDNINGIIYYCFLNNNGSYSGSVANVILEYTKK